MVDHRTEIQARETGETGLGDAGTRLAKEGEALSESLGDAGRSATARAGALGEEVAARIGSETESVRDAAAEGLVAFSDALKAASTELSGKDLGFAGDIVEQAAGGLETLARSFEGRSPAQMLEALRSFGRQNPVGFVAGSVLAGFALGRVAAVAVPSTDREPPAGVPADREMAGGIER